MSPSLGSSQEVYDVVVLGAGYAGMMAALRLGRRRLGLRVALVNGSEQFVERVRLQESMVAPVKPRIASLSRYLRRTNVQFIRARVLSLDPVRNMVTIEEDGSPRTIAFEQLIYALGSHVDTDNAPGALQHAFRLDPGEDPRSAAALRAALHALAGCSARVLAVGGGPLSVEAAGEAKSTWPNMSVTLLSLTSAGDFSSAKVQSVVRRDLTRLGVELVDNERVIEIESNVVNTASGRRFPFDICIWAAGMRAPPIATQAGLEVDAQDRVVVGTDLRSVSHPAILAVGDSAHPNGPTGAPFRASALAAAVSGVYAAEQVIARNQGRLIRPFSFSTFAQAVAVGRFAALFPLDANDHQMLFVLGGRAASVLRSILIWLVLHFITFERLLPGVQTWPGRKRAAAPSASQKSADRPDVQLKAGR
ncbi:NAD(P)/FAD-dependent oxidoreductase [Bradyrhizobium sp. GCM10027634]|uniref:NAD(P)/FAD-dependent oxidoreductase n=1 Tax=unclassified Bradyrhizobium TaxID=2631580 RepID=UPI00188CE759|nr:MULTISPECIES: FAD-dependent oxidoreductase [unclassified Bradyrhizobium]MDN5000635.1 FAD-dependent oxidoreductase [Bradyrhizobium sp. WYCCWR 12677]